MEKFLKEIYRSAVSNIPANSEEAFGNFVIKTVKAAIMAVINFFKGLKALKDDFKDKKARCKKFLMFLALSLVVFIALSITIVMAVKINQIVPYAIYAAAFISSLIPGIYIIRIGAKSKAVKVDYSKQLQRVGLFEGVSQVKDKKGNYKNVRATPQVLSIKKVNNFTTYTFRTNIVLDEWLKARNKMKSVFNSEVLDIRYAEKSYNRVIVEMATIGTDKLPNEILWKDEYYKKGKITLGMGVGNKIVRLDITKSDTVHTLIGGQTGSGKSGLSEKILNDCCRNGYHVEIIDRKGGLDYIYYEAAGVKVATTLDATLAMTSKAVRELDARLELFRKAKVRKLEDYNKTAEIKLSRYVIFIDEAAEVFSSITQRKKVDMIKENITSIVRRGRALGMNVILATQKCSAIVISTEIRSLLGTQICSYVNTTTDSRQILDHGYAASLPKIPGRFTRKIPRTAEGFQDFQVFRLTGDETIIYKPEGMLAVVEPTTFTINTKDMLKKGTIEEGFKNMIEKSKFKKPEKFEDKEEDE